MTKGPSYIVKRGRYPLGKKYKQMSSTQTFLKELKRLPLKCMSTFAKEDILEPMSLLLNYFFQTYTEEYSGYNLIIKSKN